METGQDLMGALLGVGWDRGGMGDSKVTRLLQDSLGGNRSGPPGGSSGGGIGEGWGTPS